MIDDNTVVRAIGRRCSDERLIGKNGSGKTTVGLALQILQKIARGTNRVSDLVKPKDLARGRDDVCDLKSRSN